MIFFPPRLPSTCSSDRTDAPTRFAKSIVVRSHPSRGGTNRGVRGFTVKRGFKMLTRERPDFRTVDRWAIGLLLEAGAISELRYSRQRLNQSDGLGFHHLPGVPSLAFGAGVPCLLYTSPSPRDRQKSR